MADRRLAPVRKAALRTAADSVKTWQRILLSLIGVLVLIGLGIYWGISFAAPSWWPVPDKWWLVVGWGTGATLIGSGIIALALLVYSYLNFGDPTRATTTTTTRVGRTRDGRAQRSGERPEPPVAAPMNDKADCAG